MNSLFSNSEAPGPSSPADPAPAPEVPEDLSPDAPGLSRAERRKRREAAERAKVPPVTDALARRGRADRDLMDGNREYRKVPVEDVLEDTDNPRIIYKGVEELAQNIAATGLEQPIKVWVDKQGRLHLKDGHRRLRAAKAAGLKYIEALIEYKEGNKLRQQVSANIHHEKMNPVDEGWALKRLMREEKIATEQQLAKSLGKSLGWVNLRMQLTRMTEKEQQAIREDRLSYTEAIKRRKQGRDILTGEWLNGHEIGGFAGGARPSDLTVRPTGANRFPRDVQSRQAGGASVSVPRSSSRPAVDDDDDEVTPSAGIGGEAPKPAPPAAHFSDQHSLAFRVSHRCGAHGRPTPQIGGVGCGECWEYVIRADERIVTKTDMRAAGLLAERAKD